MAHGDTGYKVVWSPQPGPQTALIQCPVFEVFFGGARGGGKTDGSIGDWLEHSNAYGDNAVGVFFRRKFKQLEEVIARTKQIFPQLGARYNEQKAEWRMKNGARLKFRYLEKDDDAQEYQGHNYTRVYVEEATNFPNPGPINLLRGTLRSAVGVPCGMRLTGNPGGPGHQWVRARYIDPAPKGYVVIKEAVAGLDPDDPPIITERVFIPSRLSDNQMLMKSDSTYVARLRQVGKAALVKAWLDGDWNIVDGAFFDEFDPERHVLPRSWERRIPPGALLYRAFDWGSARPFSVGWYAVSNGTWGLPTGALFKYREWYGARAPNEGLKMDAALVARGIKNREEGETIQYGRADPAIFIRSGGPSIAEMMSVEGITWARADNKRQAGWEQLRLRLTGGDSEEERIKDGRESLRPPMLYFSEACVDTIRTLPTLQHDPNNSEDVDTDGEDHAGDETRYAVMARPWIPDVPTHRTIYPYGKLPSEMTVNEVIERHQYLNRMREE